MRGSQVGIIDGNRDRHASIIIVDNAESLFQLGEMTFMGKRALYFRIVGALINSDHAGSAGIDVFAVFSLLAAGDDEAAGHAVGAECREALGAVIGRDWCTNNSLKHLFMAFSSKVGDRSGVIPGCSAINFFINEFL